jgi:hypothetical protein
MLTNETLDIVFNFGENVLVLKHAGPFSYFTLSSSIRL